jgi:two-component system CheB/CheR fusion protein
MAELSQSSLEKLVYAVQALSEARSVARIAEIVRRAARDLTGADGASFVLRDGDLCYYIDEDAIGPLWKGQRFPMSACVSGWVMNNAQPAVIEDIFADERVPIDAYRVTFVRSLAMVPIRGASPIGAIGNYWATTRLTSESEVAALQALADSTSVALENVQLYSDLQDKLHVLSTREALIREQRDTLDVFARSLAHDLKEPAHTINAWVQLLTKREFTDNARERYTRFILEASTRMKMLIDVVFDYTQLDPEHLSLQDFNLSEALDVATTALAPLIDEFRATVLSGYMPDVHADKALIARVLTNLIGNSIVHAPLPVRVHVGVEHDNGEVRVCVRDNGPGIAPDRQATIFEPFSRLARNNDRAGMGLAVSRKIIEYHGGVLRCDSAPGRGAAFSFALPEGRAQESHRYPVETEMAPVAAGLTRFARHT